ARQITQAFLEKEGFPTKCFDTGEELYDAFIQAPCALAIINTAMAGSGGFVVGARIKMSANIPIIIVAATPSDEDHIFSISLGLDAYFEKPFCPVKLMAHVKALLHKAALYNKAPLPLGAMPDAELTYADITLCRRKITTVFNGMPVKLTGKEFKLLAHMLENHDRAVKRSEFVSTLWGDDAKVGVRAVDDIVKRVRKKLTVALSRVSIDTVWGHGFRLGVRAE
ncbi:MAG: response regulator transcription factor, partial [Defluviitaleaceae bacterium]|nr:response regulator transcription factor [Defluviitaleaceae bacterium]